LRNNDSPFFGERLGLGRSIGNSWHESQSGRLCVTVDLSSRFLQRADVIAVPRFKDLFRSAQ